MLAKFVKLVPEVTNVWSTLDTPDVGLLQIQGIVIFYRKINWVSCSWGPYSDPLQCVWH
jgi:hypothetical protein